MPDILYNGSKNETKITLTTMCALINAKDEVLMINRCKSWKGWALPGGHIEPNESVLSCVIREMKEETGLIIYEPIFKGITHFYNNDTNERQLIFNYISFSFEGDLLHCCEEGSLRWVSKQELQSLALAEGMEQRFELFFEKGIFEMFVVWTKDDGYISKEILPYSGFIKD